MAYRFAVDGANSPFVDLSPGALVGYTPKAVTTSAFSIYVGINRNGVGTWQGIAVLWNNVGAALMHMLEFNPSNQVAGDDADGTGAWASAETFTSTTDNNIIGFGMDGTDNVAGNGTFRWKKGAAAFSSETEQVNVTGNAGNTITSSHRLRLGNNHSLGDDANFDLIVVGIRKGSRISQAQAESLSLGAGGFATWQAVFNNASTDLLLRFDNISAVTDAIGTAAETARSGGTSVTFVADPTDFYSAGGTNATVDAVPMDAAGDLVAPSVVTSVNIAAVPMGAVGDFASNMPISVEAATPPMAAIGDIPAPSVSSDSGAVIDAVPMDATGDLASPALGLTTTTPPMDAAADVIAPALSAEASTPPMDALADIVAPTSIDTSGNVNIGAVPMSSFGDMIIPALSASLSSPAALATGDFVATANPNTGSNLAAPAMASAGDIVPPSIAVDGNTEIPAVPATISGDFVAPVFSIGVTTASPPMDAVAVSPAPNLQTTSNAVAPPALAVGSLAVPGIDASYAVTILDGTGAMLPPVFSSQAVVVSPAMRAVGDFLPVGPPSDVIEPLVPAQAGLVTYPSFGRIF